MEARECLGFLKDLQTQGAGQHLIHVPCKDPPDAGDLDGGLSSKPINQSYKLLKMKIKVFLCHQQIIENAILLGAIKFGGYI